jgi:hypothetical protein
MQANIYPGALNSNEHHASPATEEEIQADVVHGARLLNMAAMYLIHPKVRLLAAAWDE